MPTIPYPIGTGANVIGPGSSTPGNLVAWQNSDGTVLEDTVVSVDGNGNLDGVGTVNGVKVYRALLTQSGTDAPVATVLENTLGGVVWTRNDTGDYAGTLAGAFPDGAKVWCNTPSFNNGNDTNITVLFRRIDADSVSIITYNGGDAAQDFSTGALVYMNLEILVYPS